MKIQDIFFTVFFVFLIYKYNPRFFVLSGLASLLFSIPLFSKWIFFTAERLTVYASAFFLAAIFIAWLRLTREY